VRGLPAALAHQRKPLWSPVAGWCRAPLFSSTIFLAFWDELWVRALSPRPDISPAYAFTQEEMRLTPGYG
jgi:hypothetical protein